MNKHNTIFGYKNKELWRPKVIPKILKRPSVKSQFISEEVSSKKRLDVIIISVDYNDFLILSLENNKKYFDNITVVTSNSDLLCQDICKKLDTKCITTDAFYESGFKFNKGKAINKGIESLIEPELILILDADIIITDTINSSEIQEDVLYTSDRWLCYNYFQYKRLIKNEINISELPKHERDNNYGFFQLFSFKNPFGVKFYPDDMENSSHPDLKFSSFFPKKQTIRQDIVHLGDIKKNWNGRVSNKFLNDTEFDELFNKKSSFTICSFYFNYNNDWRQKRNFIEFLEQWNGHYKNMIVGIVDYGDIDFEIPCEKIIIDGDINNRVWSKEMLINKIANIVETDYLIFVDGDIIYEDLVWLNDIDSLVGDKDFVQLFETINYLSESGEVIETHKSLASGQSDNVNLLLSKGFRPGGSWLTKTKILKSSPLFEKMTVGGGDTILAYGMYGINNAFTLKHIKKGSIEIHDEAKKWISEFGKRKVGYLNTTINHLYHGELKDRNYNSRYEKLRDFLTNKIEEVEISDTVNSDEKIVLYTCISGGYDTLKEVVKPESNIKYICFTDQNIQSRTWEIREIPKYLEYLDQTKRARCLKILPHLFLHEYTISVWIDANIQVIGNINQLINNNIGSHFSIPKHPDRTCVYEEAKAVISLNKDIPENVNSQIDRYKKMSYPENHGLVQSNVIIRQHNKKDCISISEGWWYELLFNSKRDQLSFNFSIWKKDYEINIIKPSIICSEFLQIYKHNHKGGHKTKIRVDYDVLKNYINGIEV